MVFLRTSEKTGKDAMRILFKSYNLYVISCLFNLFIWSPVPVCSTKLLFFRGMLSKNRSNGWRNWLEVAFDCSALSETALWCCESILNFLHLIFFVLSSQCHHLLVDSLMGMAVWMLMYLFTQLASITLTLTKKMTKEYLFNFHLCD